MTMKNLIIISFLSIALFSCSNNATKDEASNHNDQVVKLQEKLIYAGQDAINAFIDGNFEDAKKLTKNWKLVSKDVLSKSNKIDPIDDQDDLRKSLIKLTEKYIDIIDNEIPQLISVIEKTKRIDIDQEEYDSLVNGMNNMIYEIDNKCKNVNEQFLKDQKAFGKRYDLNLNFE